MAAKSYQVVAGKHHHDDGHTYTKGQLVKSEGDLTKSFPGKFALVPEDGAPAGPAQQAEAVLKRPVTRNLDVAPELRGMKKPKDTKDFAGNDDLDADEAAEAAQELQSEEEELLAEYQENLKAAKAASPKSKLGQDATEEFDDAGDHLVFRRGRKFSVAHKDSPDRPVRGGKELTKSEVTDLLQKQQKAKAKAEKDEE